MPDEIFISIIIPFYNSQNHIENCLDSLQKQSFKKTYEIIMVDDGSTDGSVEIIKKCKNPFVKIFKLKENKGPAAARNFCNLIDTFYYLYCLKSKVFIYCFYLWQAWKFCNFL